MTSQISLRSIDIPQLYRFGVGFDRTIDRIEELLRSTSNQSSGYPPYNIVKHSDDIYSIEIAVAGFKQGDISIEVKENVLTIQGKKIISLDETEAKEYVHHGISSRDFVRNFPLGEHVEVTSAYQENGILTVCLERQLPEEKKPKTIPIEYKV